MPIDGVLASCMRAKGYGGLRQISGPTLAGCARTERLPFGKCLCIGDHFFSRLDLRLRLLVGSLCGLQVLLRRGNILA